MASRKKAPTTDKRCGTRAGYSAHGRRGERACSACMEANRARTAKRRSAASGGASSPAVSQGSGGGAPVGVAAAERRPESSPAAVPAPAWLKERGRALWDQVTADYTLTPAALVLLGEACRTADRLERLAAALASGKTLWFELGDAAEGAEELGVPIVVNGMIGEARQLQGALRQTLSSLGVVGVDAVAGEVKRNPLDEIAARRAARLAAAGES